MQDYLSRPVPPQVKNPETRLLAEYLHAKFPHYVSMTRVPLGPAVIGEAGLGPNATKIGAARPWRPEVDAVVFMVDPSEIRMLPQGPRGVLLSAPATGTLLLIEAKVVNYLDGLAKLPFYRALVASTPELEPVRGWDLRMRLVIAQDAPWVQIGAQVADVEVDIYDPPWLAEYRQYRQRYWTREWREERLRVNQIRKQLGL
jgi:hypothetical protein